ncbi:MAG: hypothetical protein HQL65_17440 [Magnetococcales bacterium]|nr:hypothetical protein [Magnetococcales bacterium]
MRLRSKCRLPLLAILIGGLLLPYPLLAEEVTTQPNNLEKLGDLLILRPLGLVATVMGSVAFVVTLPLLERETGVLDRARDSREMFIYRPLRYTFSRPLGQLETQE